MYKKIVFYIFLLGFTFFTIEFLAYGIGLVLAGKGYLYRPSKIVTATHVKDYNDYLSYRDNVLGWPPPKRFGKGHLDLSGSRRVPAFDDPAKYKSCVSLYGESFTQGGEVDDEHAWGNLLSNLLSCRVANYGIGGYGTDQAYLRFKHNNKDEANLVILGYMSENIERNLTRVRDLLTAEQSFALKPRFVLNKQGNLELIPLPDLSEHTYQQLLGIQSPILELENENFYPGGPAHTTLFQFPYTYTLIKNMNYFRIRAKLAGRPWYSEFYTENHPFKGLEITVEIIKAFVNEAKQKDKLSLVLLFPMAEDLTFYRKVHYWTYENLIKALDTNKIPYLNFGPHLLEQTTNNNLQKFFAPRGHYNEEGNRILAGFVYAYLKNLPNLTNPVLPVNP